MDPRIKAALAALKGSRIADARILADGALILEFAGGASALVQCDPEGNGPGSLHYYPNDDADAVPIGGR